MPRFVLLYHQCPPDYPRRSHWDLMLEAKGALRTWALAELPRAWRAAYGKTVTACGECPPLAAGNEVEAQALSDHRPAYLDYQGPVSGERGTVTRIAAGTYDELGHAPDNLEVSLLSAEWNGGVVLTRDSSGSERWRLTCRSEGREA